MFVHVVYVCFFFPYFNDPYSQNSVTIQSFGSVQMPMNKTTFLCGVKRFIILYLFCFVYDCLFMIVYLIFMFVCLCLFMLFMIVYLCCLFDIHLWYLFILSLSLSVSLSFSLSVSLSFSLSLCLYSASSIKLAISFSPIWTALISFTAHSIARQLALKTRPKAPDPTSLINSNSEYLMMCFSDSNIWLCLCFC